MREAKQARKHLRLQDGSADRMVRRGIQTKRLASILQDVHPGIREARQWQKGIAYVAGAPCFQLEIGKEKDEQTKPRWNYASAQGKASDNNATFAMSDAISHASEEVRAATFLAAPEINEGAATTTRHRERGAAWQEALSGVAGLDPEAPARCAASKERLTQSDEIYVSTPGWLLLRRAVAAAAPGVPELLDEGGISDHSPRDKRGERAHPTALTGSLGSFGLVDPLGLRSPKKSKKIGGEREGEARFEVVLVGMEGRLQVHNGEVGKLAKVNAEKDKCEVHLSDEVLARESEDKGHIKVKGLKHILPVAATGGPLGAGTPVVICRLRNHAELNGWPGRILEKSQGRTEDQSRYVVRAAESGQLFRVKRDNLVQVEPDALSKVGMDEAFHMDFNEQMRSMKAKLDQTQSGFGAAAVKKPNTKNPEEKGLVTLPEVPGAATGRAPPAACQWELEST
ncbi:unnamed protein product [Prorocentrum cordatum]|uniref:Uncharacterized protein n=1 Tax=Prorocentrum cordatum TaxID=2364126 RepID=A0ABN9X5N8_9DINO|nr:unnamed protein product [Polarella glacialis]